MATTMTKEKTTSTPKAKKRNTSIAQFAIRHHDKELAKIFEKDASMLPENKWIIQTSKKLINEDQDFKKKIQQTTLIGAGVVVGIAGIITAAFTAPLAIAVAVGAVVGTAAAVGVDKIKSLVKDMKANHLPKMVDKFKMEILKDKVNSAKQAFNRKKAALFKKKAENPAPPRKTKAEGETFKQMKKEAAKWAFKKAVTAVKGFTKKKTNDNDNNKGQNNKKSGPKNS